MVPWSYCIQPCSLGKDECAVVCSSATATAAQEPVIGWCHCCSLLCCSRSGSSWNAFSAGVSSGISIEGFQSWSSFYTLLVCKFQVRPRKIVCVQAVCSHIVGGALGAAFTLRSIQVVQARGWDNRSSWLSLKIAKGRENSSEGRRKLATDFECRPHCHPAVYGKLHRSRLCKIFALPVLFMVFLQHTFLAMEGPLPDISAINAFCGHRVVLEYFPVDHSVFHHFAGSTPDTTMGSLVRSFRETLHTASCQTYIEDTVNGTTQARAILCVCGFL